MSTHCGIAVKTEKGYNTIYVHHDGYESYMYPMLTKNYNSEERATDLVSLGDASSIQARMVPSRDSGHSFDNPEDGVCIFYHRDRGERWTNCEPSCLTKAEVLNNYHAYIWEDGKWTAYKNGRINHNVKNLY
jgi:hypothetical protein